MRPPNGALAGHVTDLGHRPRRNRRTVFKPVSVQASRLVRIAVADTAANRGNYQHLEETAAAKASASAIEQHLVAIDLDFRAVSVAVHAQILVLIPHGIIKQHAAGPPDHQIQFPST